MSVGQMVHAWYYIKYNTQQKHIHMILHHKSNAIVVTNQFSSENCSAIDFSSPSKAFALV